MSVIRVEGQGSGVKGSGLRLWGLVIFFAYCALSLNGCAPTYPKEKFRESILKICKNEYKLDVKIETIGKTIAIYIPLHDLMDFTFTLTASASEKINDVILSVSRVALSSDANYNFFCIVAHDVRIPEIQLVIIKSVMDVKRFLLNDISRSEYSKRMLIDLRLSPQAQKERSIKEVFEKMGLDKKWQEQVMNDFFRSEPAGLGDIGYWNNHFYVKDISHAEFLAEQIASRIRIESREDKNLVGLFLIKSAKGTYASKFGKRYYRFEVAADPKWFKDIDYKDVSNKIMQLVLRVAGHVLHGYSFAEFEYVEVLNQTDGRYLKVSRNDLERLRAKKMKFEELVSK